jgi:hypothetical protein
VFELFELQALRNHSRRKSVAVLLAVPFFSERRISFSVVCRLSSVNLRDLAVAQ